jgi:hypothetical protein
MELSTCKKFNDLYADMCRMDESKCGKKATQYSPIKQKENDKVSDLAK